MICDFKNVTDVLMRNISSGASIYYANVLNILFGAYLLESKIYSFDNSTACKLHKGTQRVNPKMSEFYINSDKEIMKRDIKSFIGYIFDKPNTYRELYLLWHHGISGTLQSRLWSGCSHDSNRCRRSCPFQKGGHLSRS